MRWGRDCVSKDSAKSIRDPRETCILTCLTQRTDITLDGSHHKTGHNNALIGNPGAAQWLGRRQTGCKKYEM